MDDTSSHAPTQPAPTAPFRVEDVPWEEWSHGDTGKVSVRSLGESYRRSGTVDYWEGESAE